MNHARATQGAKAISAALLALWCVSALASIAGAATDEEARWAKKTAAWSKSITDAEVQRIAAAIPAKPAATPARPRKLLIFDLNLGYGGHRSIVYANLAFEMMGRKTGAFTTVICRDISMFKPENLRQFDAVCFNNTVCFSNAMGKLFENAGLKKSLLEFVYSGKGLIAIHGATSTFLQWPEYGRMLGAYLAGHPWSRESVTIKLDDPGHPLNAPFNGQGFQTTDEIYQFKAPYSRDRLRVLLSLDTTKTDMNKPGIRRTDNDFAVSWVRSYGRGRVFYCSLGHGPSIFWNPKLLRHYLAGIQFALGDLPAGTTPSGKLTPAIRAHEKLGWRLGTTAYSFRLFTFFEAIDKAASLGLGYIQSINFLPVSKDIPRKMNHALPDDVLAKIRRKLDSAGVRLVSHYIHSIPGDEAACRKVFEFGRKMGIETFVGEPAPEALDTIEKLCEEYRINVAIHNHGKGKSRYWHPREVLKVCKGRSKRIGACGDMGYWLRAGIRPLDAVKMLKDRLILLEAHDLDEDGHDVPWGTGRCDFEAVIREIRRQGIKPTMFSIEYSHKWENNMPEIAKCAQFFNRLARELAGDTKQ